MTDIQAQLADGTILSFPEGTPDEVINRTVKQQTLAAKAAALKPTLDAQAAKYPTNGPKGVDDEYPTVNNFMSNLWGSADRNIGAPLRSLPSTIWGGVEQAADMLRHPVDTALAGGPMAVMAKQALTPAATQAMKGDYSGAAGDLAGIGLSFMVPEAASGMAGTVAPIMRGGAAAALPEALRLKEMANAAQDYRTGPSAQPLEAAQKADMPRSVNLARQAARVVKRGVASGVEYGLNKAAEFQGDRGFRIDTSGNVSAGDTAGMGNPDSGSAAFMPENLTRPPDAPVMPRTADPTPAAPPEAGPLNIPRPAPAKVPQAQTLTAAEQAKAQLKRLQDGIAASPTDKGAVASSIRNGPRLMKTAPELADLQPGPEFDAGLVDAFRKRELAVEAAEKAVPRAAVVEKAPILAKWRAIAQEANSSPFTRAAAASLNNAIKAWNQLPAEIPWEQFTQLKRAFLKDTKTPVFRRAYQELMDQANAISKDLETANADYSVVRRALDDAKIIVARDEAGNIINAQRVRPPKKR